MLKFLNMTKNFSIFFLKKLRIWQLFYRNTVYMKKEGRSFIIFSQLL